MGDMDAAAVVDDRTWVAVKECLGCMPKKRLARDGQKQALRLLLIGIARFVV